MKWRHFIFWGVIGLALLAMAASVVFAIVLPLVWRLQFGEPPPDTTLDLSIIVATIFGLVALMASAFGGGTYYILSRQLRDQAEKAADMRSRRATAVSLNYQGFYNWRHYVFTRDNHKQPDAYYYLDAATDITRVANDDFASKLDEKEPYYEKVICEIRNNLVYYLAEKKRQGQNLSPGDRELALRYADYIEERLIKYPGKAEAWSDTITFVRQHLKS